MFPLAPNTKRPRAELVDWEHRATTDPGRIARWWAAHPRDNVAIACGPSGLVVVDLDTPKAGEEPPEAFAGARHGLDVLAELADRHGTAVACTWTVQTPSGGRHLYYRAPNGTGLRNTSGRMGWHIDTRAQGGYVVAAGSTIDRWRYRVLDHRPPIELPAWITRALTAEHHRRRPAVTPVSSRNRYVAAAVGDEVRRVIEAGPGGRNHALNKAAWNLGKLVAAGQLSRGDVEDVLQNAGEASGYADGPRAVRAVIRAALDARLHRT